MEWVGGEKLGEKHFTMSHPKYDQTLIGFVEEVYQTNLMSKDYLGIIDERGLNGSELIDAIDHADLELLKALLTGYIRQERFGDGLWAQAVDNKAFLKILKRFDQITK